MEIFFSQSLILSNQEIFLHFDLISLHYLRYFLIIQFIPIKIFNFSLITYVLGYY